jgi:hypothetical protein
MTRDEIEKKINLEDDIKKNQSNDDIFKIKIK